MTDIEIPLGKRSPKYRFFEMLPAILSYSMLLLPVVLSIISPLWAAVFIIVYIISWLVRALGMAFRTIQGYGALEQAKRVDWGVRLKDIEDLSTMPDHARGWRAAEHIKALRRISRNPSEYFKPSQIYNVVIIAIYNENRDVLEPTIKAVLASDFPNKKQTALFIAYEERGGVAAESMVKDLLAQYSDGFLHAEACKHPANISGEVIGKGGNITWTGRRVQAWAEETAIPPDKVIVTTLDSDNRPHPSYFSNLVYEFIVHPDRKYLAFQPIALFLNNIWDVPAPMRVIATGNSFWTIINSFRPHMLRNFAAHSQGLSALIDTDFWSVRTIVEDGHQFWRSYFRYDGRYDVVPILIPIYQDAVLSYSLRRTLKAQFIQLRRWAYGASDIAYVAWLGFRKNRTVPLLNVIAKFIRLVDGHVSWATASVILTFGAWAPLLINPQASRSIIAHQLPGLASQLQRIAMVGIFITIFLAFRMLPPRPMRYKRRRTIWMILQWGLMPVVSLIYASAASLYSQTRLLLGKYLDKFDITDKAVVKHKTSVFK
ncbi:MAG: hypothetical protein EOT04_01350 [Candidatus Chaera renei]|uniref:Glycosyltransferase 2-like domain-containing protein n=1 Tax=Candidatus Chaera renei TaxID=2506947 RepID=A0A4Q0AJ32_9BACT|nr:MAG: hypothetical protein EOT04_01350 [Candidatus Chaera renei]